MPEHFKVDVDADGIALVTWDMPGRSMNVIDLKVIEELAGVVEQVASDAAIKGAVITSGKDTFCAGADLTLLETLGRTFQEIIKAQGEEAAAVKLFEESRKLSQVYRRLETSGKPWVAAINGTALGGGFELALACHHRVAAENDKTRLGLPEIKIGLFPGAGGTQRVARMMAPADALQFLLKGDQLRLSRAKGMKLVDNVVPAADLVKTAKDWIKAGGKAKAPWDVDGFKLPGGLVYSKGGMMTFPAANAIYRRETFDNYPAARAILQVVYEGLQLSMDRALTVEVALVRENPALAGSGGNDPLVVRLHAGFEQRRPAAGGRSGLQAQEGRHSRRRVHGRRHRLCQRAGGPRRRAHRPRPGERGQGQGPHSQADDRSRQQGPRQDCRSRRTARAYRRHRRLRRPQGLRPRGRGGIRGSQGQGRRHRQGAGRRARHRVRLQHLDPSHQFARGNGEGSRPLHRHPFLLTGRAHDAGRDHHGETTGGAALALALDYVRAIRKTPIVVNNSRGFYTSRVVGTYIREGHLMLTEGIPAAMVENVGRMAGMPVGPLSLNDEVAVDLAWKILKATEADLAPRRSSAAEEAAGGNGREARPARASNT